jgi:hypothetical protein
LLDRLLLQVLQVFATVRGSGSGTSRRVRPVSPSVVGYMKHAFVPDRR